MDIGKLLISLGVLLIVLGVVFNLMPKLHLFKLPGDIVIKGNNFTFYFPIATSILISVLLTIFLNLKR
ncbi:MAG: DUF2905 domain-containing protein [bacterium]|nr:DUF2905 domain-containing protein [bacterium]